MAGGSSNTHQRNRYLPAPSVGTPGGGSVYIVSRVRLLTGCFIALLQLSEQCRHF